MSTAITLISNTQDLLTFADHFAKSGYFQDTASVQQAVVKISYGNELGISPFQAMSGIHVIKGKPVVGASLIASIIKRSGKYNYKIIELTDKVCTIDFYEGSEVIGKSTFTDAEAQAAGTQNMGKFPKNMLFARAISNGAKWYCPDVFGGNIYTEGDNFDNVPTETATYEVIAPVVQKATLPNECDEAFPTVEVDKKQMILEKAKALYPKLFNERLSSIIEMVKEKKATLDECDMNEQAVIFRYLREREKGAFTTAAEANDWIETQMGRTPKTAPKARIEEATYTEIPKAPKTTAEKLRAKFHAIGTQTFGKEWDLARKCITVWVNTKYTSSNEMTDDEFGRCIEQMEMSENDRDLTLQSRLEIIKTVPML